MRKPWKIAILSGVLLAGIGGTASADPRVRFSIGLGVPAPAVYAPYYPAPAYYPAPGYYPASQVLYAPPPAVYYAPPVLYRPPVRIVYGSPYWRARGHHHWR